MRRSPSWIPPRRTDANKFDFGHVLVLGGSRGLMGAPRLAALGALRGGAGLVTVGVPAPLEPVAAQGPWESMTLSLPGTLAGFHRRAVKDVEKYVERRRVTSLVIGPGLGGDPVAGDFVEALLRECSTPAVVDADGLNSLARRGPVETETPLILTPHEGEMGRLLGISSSAVKADRSRAVQEAARRYRTVVVLKGNRTLVSDGENVYVNRSGTPAMATGGMGDVLAGLIAALVAQVSADSLPERLWRAAVMGVDLHGRAAERAHRQRGGLSVLATDVVHRI